MPNKIPEIVERIPCGKSIYSVYRFVKDNFRKLIFYVQNGTHYNRSKFYNHILKSSAGECSHQTDIFDHLSTIFFFATDANPKLMVELGTRGGESTRALLAATSVTNSILLSIDIEDPEQDIIDFQEHWHFVKTDDIEFGKTEFNSWCLSHSIEPVIDLLFIDTSHDYLHTKQEIKIWSKYLSDKGTIIFHDTNMRKGVYVRNDGSIGFGWNNERGVVKAIEEFVNRQYDENSYFCDVTDKYNLIHFPNCNGLTVLKKRME